MNGTPPVGQRTQQPSGNSPWELRTVGGLTAGGIVGVSASKGTKALIRSARGKGVFLSNRVPIAVGALAGLGTATGITSGVTGVGALDDPVKSAKTAGNGFADAVVYGWPYAAGAAIPMSIMPIYSGCKNEGRGRSIRRAQMKRNLLIGAAMAIPFALAGGGIYKVSSGSSETFDEDARWGVDLTDAEKQSQQAGEKWIQAIGSPFNKDGGESFIPYSAVEPVRTLEATDASDAISEARDLFDKDKPAMLTVVKHPQQEVYGVTYYNPGSGSKPSTASASRESESFRSGNVAENFVGVVDASGSWNLQTDIQYPWDED